MGKTSSPAPTSESLVGSDFPFAVRTSSSKCLGRMTDPSPVVVGLSVSFAAAVSCYWFVATNVWHQELHVAMIDLAFVCHGILALALVDFVFTRHSRARWLYLHALGNLLVTITALDGTIRTFRDPLKSFDGRSSLGPASLVPAIHIYHLVAFACSTDDIVHHLVFAGVICPFGFYLDLGSIQAAVAFFICGLPGGIDYAMLALVKTGRMQSITEKIWNARINVWLRSPGLLFCAVTVVLCQHDDHALMTSFAAFLLYLNGQYYMQVVVGNTFIRSRERKFSEQGVKPYNC